MSELVLDRVPQDRKPSYTIRDFLIALFFHKRAILIALLLPITIGIFASAVSKTIFTANARLLVLLGSEYILQPTVGQTGAGMSFDRNQIIQSELEILQSDRIREETIRKLGVQYVYPPLPTTELSISGILAEIPFVGGFVHAAPTAAVQTPRHADTEQEIAAAAARMKNDLSIASVPMSNVINLAYRNADSKVSAEVLNTFVNTYIARRAEIFRREGADPGDLERNQYATRLRDAEAELARFGDENRVSSFDEQVTLTLHDQADLVRDLDQTQSRLTAVSAQVVAMQQQLKQIAPNVELYAETQRSPVSATLTDTLLKLEGTRRDLMSRYKPDYPPIADLDRQIAAVRGQLGHAGGQNAMEPSINRRGQNPVYVEMSAQLDKLVVERDGLNAQRADLIDAGEKVQSRLNQLNTIGSRWRELKRTRDVLEETYRAYVRNTEEARLTDQIANSRLANVRIVQSAEPPPTGARPRKLILMASASFGVFAAMALFWILSAMRQTMIGVIDTERELQLPVLVSIPDRRALTQRAAPVTQASLFRASPARAGDDA